MNALDRAIATISPGWAVKRARSRLNLDAYDAANTAARTRKTKRERRSGNSAVGHAGKSLREQARWLDENHDLVVSVLDTFCANVVGATGISIEPMPKTSNGELHAQLARDITRLLENWSMYPETRGELDRAGMEKLTCLTWARDGECFMQHAEGRFPGLDHKTMVPYSIELFEPDLIPFDYEDPMRNVIQGIQCNEWGQPITYFAYRTHPGDLQYRVSSDVRPIPASRVSHLKLTRRIGQRRGVSRLAAVLQRLEDVKDYEESERVAARIAAAMAAYVKKGTPDQYMGENVDEDGNRTFSVAPGVVWDNLYVGEDVGTIQSNRPSNLLTPFRDAMMRAISGGTQTGYSSVSKNYSGTYSAQRQELVEQFVHYSSNTQHFIAQVTRPNYGRFLNVAIASGVLSIPRDIDMTTLYDAEYRGPVMPWIDPAREATAAELLVQAGFKSRSQTIRERGGNPQDVYDQIKREREQDYQDGLIFSSDAATKDMSVTDKIVTGDPDYVDQTADESQTEAA